MNGAGAAVLYYTASTTQGSLDDKQLRATIFPP